MVEDFIDQYKERKGEPDLIIILSALWDINRWGPRFVSSKMNCVSYDDPCAAVSSSTRRIAKHSSKR